LLGCNTLISWRARLDPKSSHSNGDSIPKITWWRALSWLPGAIILVGMIIFILGHEAEGEKLLHLFVKAHLAWLLLALVLQVGTYFCAALTWQRVLAKTGTSPPLLYLALLALKKVFIDQFLPSAGVGSTIVILRSLEGHDVPPRNRAATMMLYFFGYYVAYVFAGALSLGLFLMYRKLSKIILSIAALFFLMGLGAAASIFLLTRTRHWEPPPWITRFAWTRKLIKAVAQVPPHLMKDPWLLFQVIGLQFFIFVLDGATLYTILIALGHPLGAIKSFISFMFASMTGTVSPIPGGLGTFEAGLAGTLALFKIRLKAALAATLMLRSFTLWLPLIPGFIVSRKDLFHRKKKDEIPQEVATEN